MDTSGLSLEQWQKTMAFAYAHRTMADAALGRVLDCVEQLGLGHDTAIVFTADHGDMCGAHNRFDKGPYFYDEVWRIPLTIKLPHRAAAQQDAFVSILDIGSTMFHLLGAERQDRARPLGGRSLAKLVGRSDCSGKWRDEVFGVYDRYNGMSFIIRALRTREWKYVWNPQAVDELYDLQGDPAELHNRIDDTACGPVRDVLRERLFAWMDEIHDPVCCNEDKFPAAGTILGLKMMGP